MGSSTGDINEEETVMINWDDFMLGGITSLLVALIAMWIISKLEPAYEKRKLKKEQEEERKWLLYELEKDVNRNKDTIDKLKNEIEDLSRALTMIKHEVRSD